MGEMGISKRYSSLKVQPLLTLKSAGKAKQRLSREGSVWLQTRGGVPPHSTSRVGPAGPELWAREWQGVRTTFWEDEIKRPK